MGNGMISAPQPEAAETGVEIMRAGGNAMDAAIACALVQGVIDPLMCGIAGFGSMGAYFPGHGAHEYIDFHAPAPRAARPDMWESLIEGEARDGYGFILRGRVNDIGYQSICVPASLKAYEIAHREYGALPWKEIVAPAIDWAERGWMVRPHVAYFWSEQPYPGSAPSPERLRFSKTGRALYCREDGSPKRAGDTVRNPELGLVLRRIAREGASVFYEGEIAAHIEADMRARGGLISREDLSSFEPRRTAPLSGTYRDYQLATNRPPGGGIMLVEMLNILERFDLTSLGHNTAAYLRILAEAMKRATIDKDRHVGDPAFFDVPVERLTSKAYAAEKAAEIKAGKKALVTRLNTGRLTKDTTHISVIDGAGNCVAMTHSLGMPSGVITDGLGFMYNGCMAVFDPRPGRAGSIAPGKARFSSVCPSIVFRERKPCLVIGAPGATQIAMGVLQAMLNVLDFGMTMTEAVSAPRFSATSNAIDVSNRIPRFVTNALAAEGYEVVRSPSSFGFAAVHAIRVTEHGLDGGADPDHDGVALAV
ncbi:MAG: gamma-glutamyltransferase [Acetobacteraceae bacterium]|nr:gamma-glutamyltransferase [Acetobacteraceae bacterium]